jgi:hypothetical protein
MIGASQTGIPSIAPGHFTIPDPVKTAEQYTKEQRKQMDAVDPNIDKIGQGMLDKILGYRKDLGMTDPYTDLVDSPKFKPINGLSNEANMARQREMEYLNNKLYTRRGYQQGAAVTHNGTMQNANITLPEIYRMPKIEAESITGQTEANRALNALQNKDAAGLLNKLNTIPITVEEQKLQQRLRYDEKALLSYFSMSEAELAHLRAMQMYEFTVTVGEQLNRERAQIILAIYDGGKNPLGAQLAASVLGSSGVVPSVPQQLQAMLMDRFREPLMKLVANNDMEGLAKQTAEIGQMFGGMLG